jgi:DNA polymerase-3 subunit delta'
MARAPQVQELEALPEADRLGSFPHPRMTRALYGHETAEQAIAAAVKSKRLHHGWLLTGPEGIGKATFAYRFARHLLADPSERDALGVSLEIDPQSRAGRQVAALSHPGLLVIRRPYDSKSKRFAATIPVDEVRRIRSFLTHTPDVGQWRVVIVDSADELNASAANALLKSLEEPPPQTVFLLVSAQPGRLLATIRSRCRTFAFQPLNGENLRRAVHQAIAATEDAPAPGAQNWDDIAQLAKGSLRRALAFVTSGNDKLLQRVNGLLDLLPKVDWPGVHVLSDELAGVANEQRFLAFYDLLLDALERMIRAEATGEGGEVDRARAKRIVGQSRLALYADAWDAIEREKMQCLALNLDRKALILATVARLEGLARS